MNISFGRQRSLLTGYDFLQSQSDTKPVKVLVNEFIQNVVFTPFPQEGELQVERLNLAANIYDSIGFKRKAAFFRRFAALKAVTVQPNWQSCYDSLLGCISDFGLNLDPIEYEKRLFDRSSSVWPSLHIQLIEELVTCCKKIQTAQAGTLAIRHTSFMLHTLEYHIPVYKKKDFARDLEELSTIYGEDSPVTLKLSSGYQVPTVNFTKYPLCSRFEPMALAMPLRPQRMSKIRRKATLTPNMDDKTSDNPFIFTPISSYSSMPTVDSRRTSTNSLITGITWVQDEPCQIQLIVRNTLPFELKVTSLNILSDGHPLETKPLSITLPADSGNSTSIQLVGLPRQSSRADDDTDALCNKIHLFGYSTHLLGVKSNCRLDMMPKSKFPSQYIVEVSPPLPRVEFQMSHETDCISVDPIPLDQVGKDSVIMDVTVTLPMGGSLETNLSILNSSNVDLTYLVVDERKFERNLCSQKLISWQDDVIDEINGHCLKAGSKIELPITIKIPEDAPKSDEPFVKLLTFEYSGGLALKDLYCRRCAIKVSIMQARAQKKDDQD